MSAYKKDIKIVQLPGMALIGTFLHDGEGLDFIRLQYPCILQRTSPTNLTLIDMLKDGVCEGIEVQVNMKTVLWIAEPTSQVISAYQAQRSGLVAVPHLQGVKMNQ